MNPLHHEPCQVEHFFECSLLLMNALKSHVFESKELANRDTASYDMDFSTPRDWVLALLICL